MARRRQCLFILSYIYFAKKLIYYLNKDFSKLVWKKTLQTLFISFIVWEI